MLRTFFLCGILAIGVYVYRYTHRKNECYMTFTYFDNFMEPIPLKGKTLDACKMYKLGVYRESEYAYLPTGTEGTLPVLFIPGSQGNVKQIRSIATIAFELYLMRELNYTFEFFSLDFFEDSSAISTEILNRQTECVASVIPFIYNLFSKKPAPLLIIAHSMGGLVAHYALANGSFDPSLVNTVLAISSPLKFPVVSLGYNLQSIYKCVHEFWNKKALQPQYDHITYLSITGGMSDHLVWDGLGAVGLPSDRALHLSTQAVSQVWLSCDHLCILWCKQFLIQINKALFGIVNVTDRTYLSRQDRMDFLREIFLSRPVPVEPLPRPSALKGGSTLSPVDVRKGCKWVNRIGGSCGVFVTPITSVCTYLKIGPISGHPNERLLLITNSAALLALCLLLLQVNVKGVYLCNKSTESIPCNALLRIPEHSIQTIIVPTNSSDNYRHRKLMMISFNDRKKDGLNQSSLDGYFVVVHLTYRMEGSLMFDLIYNLDNRLLKSDKSKSSGYVDLPRTQNMGSFFRIPLSVNDYHFGPSLPAPQIQIEPDSCSSDVDLYGIIMFSLPWDNQVYLHRFNPTEAESFVLQTVTPVPSNYASLQSPFVDVIIDPRCNNKKMHIYYSYAYWVIQIFRVHFFNSLSIVVGHVLLSVFILLVLNIPHLQKTDYRKLFNGEKYDLTNQKPAPNSKVSNEGLLLTIAFHYAVAITIYFLHIIRLSIDDSSYLALVLPTSTWINKERRGHLGSTLNITPTHSPLIASPLFLLHSMCAIVIPVLIHCITNCHTPLVLALCGLSRTQLSDKLDRLRLCLNCREDLASFYLTLACICVGGFIHDGAAFLLLSVALILRSAATPVEQIIQSPVDLALRLRFALLFIFCSFLCVEQWITHFFRVKTFLAGFGFESSMFYQPSFLQQLLVLHLLIISALFNPKTSFNGRRFSSLPLIVLLIVASLLGSLACLGGYLNAAESLEACLAVVMPTAFSLYNLWVVAGTIQFRIG